MSEYTVESGVPVPEGNCTKYPFHKMEVNDSFTVPLAEGRKVAASAYSFGIKHNVHFVTRKIDNKVRIWRDK